MSYLSKRGINLRLLALEDAVISLECKLDMLLDCVVVKKGGKKNETTK